MAQSVLDSIFREVPSHIPVRSMEGKYPAYSDRPTQSPVSCSIRLSTADGPARKQSRLSSEFCGSSQYSHQARLSCVSSATSSGTVSEATWDILGIGQSMVDFSANVDDSFLEQINVEKGGRRIIGVEERGRILELLSDSDYEVRAGGSLANTLANLGRLGMAEQELRGAATPRMRVGAVSIAGTDFFGSFHQSEQDKAGVETLSTPLPGSSTGTVIVLTTPDANRTFLSYLGTSQELCVDPAIRSLVRQSRLVTIEGYVWEMPNAAESIQQVINVAHEAGIPVAMTAGDANVIHRHRPEMWNAFETGIDILFANKAEAQALLGKECTAERAALDLGPFCDMAVVTDGANGSCISAMGHLQVVPPYWATSKPVDTCGAGDGYAAGLIYGWLTNMDPVSMGRSGARVASSVIAKQGANLNFAEACDLVSTLHVSAPSPPSAKASATK